jgi:hypothetical protein
LLAAGANHGASDWARVGAEASFDLVAVANLNRRLVWGWEGGLARLDGAIRRLIAPSQQTADLLR